MPLSVPHEYRLQWALATPCYAPLSSPWLFPCYAPLSFRRQHLRPPWLWTSQFPRTILCCAPLSFVRPLLPHPSQYPKTTSASNPIPEGHPPAKPRCALRSSSLVHLAHRQCTAATQILSSDSRDMQPLSRISKVSWPTDVGKSRPGKPDDLLSTW